MFVPHLLYLLCWFFKIHCQCTARRVSVCFSLTVSLSRRAPNNRAIVGRWSTLPPTVCRPSIDSQVTQLSVDCQLTLHRQSTDGQPMVDQLSIDWNLIDCALTIDWPSIDTWSMVDRQLIDCPLLAAKVHLVLLKLGIHILWYPLVCKTQWMRMWVITFPAEFWPEKIHFVVAGYSLVWNI